MTRRVLIFEYDDEDPAPQILSHYFPNVTRVVFSVTHGPKLEEAGPWGQVFGDRVTGADFTLHAEPDEQDPPLTAAEWHGLQVPYEMRKWLPDPFFGEPRKDWA